MIGLLLAPAMAESRDQRFNWAWEYSSYRLPETGVTRGYKIFRWGSAVFVTDDGETMYKCRYVWTENAKQELVKSAIQEKYPGEKNVDDLVKNLEKSLDDSDKDK